jgi:hypothetical protein
MCVCVLARASVGGRKEEDQEDQEEEEQIN